MQPMESNAVRATHRRTALTTLLAYAITGDDLTAFLNGILDNHATPEARLHTWENLVDLDRTRADIEIGADVDFDPREADDPFAEAARTNRYNDTVEALEIALNAAAGITVPADLRRAA